MPIKFEDPRVLTRVAAMREHAARPENRRRLYTATMPSDDAVTLYVEDPPIRIVYSIDAGAVLGMWFRHVAVSTLSRGTTLLVPTPLLMREIATLFGFTDQAIFGTMHPDPTHVIHVIEPFSEEV